MWLWFTPMTANLILGARGREESADNGAVAREFRFVRARLALDAPPGAARELAGCFRGSVDDRRDLVEGQVEHVMQHEGDAFRRGQLLQHDQHGEADRIGEHRLMLEAARVGLADRGLGDAGAERILATLLAGAQHVEADAGYDGGEPAAEIADLRRVGTREPQPGFLYGILRLGGRAQHAVGDTLEVAAIGLELLFEKIFFAHGHIPRSGCVRWVTNGMRPV